MVLEGYQRYIKGITGTVRVSSSARKLIMVHGRFQWYIEGICGTGRVSVVKGVCQVYTKLLVVQGR